MTFEFDGDGFLSARSGELEGDIYAAYRDLFEAARRINRDCHELLFSADIRNRDGQAVIVATLFMRVLEHYQATITLVGRGITSSARATLRALVEATFKIRAVATNTDAYKTFILEDLVHRKKLINKAKINGNFNFGESQATIPDNLVKELEQQIKTTGAKELTTKEWSELAGMHDWYLTNYALLSKAVHTSVRELEDYLKIGNSGEIQQFRYAPSIHELPLLILTAAHCVLIAAWAFDKEFEMGFGQKGDEHTKFVEAGFQAVDDAI
jgi:hypothetical protein